MRVWHEELIPHLNRQHILGAHREIAALKGLGWGKKHSTVDYIFTHNPYKLHLYHMKLMQEMKNRGYKPDKLWENPLYRGKKSNIWSTEDLDFKIKTPVDQNIYAEHNDTHLWSEIDLLISKNKDYANLKEEFLCVK